MAVCMKTDLDVLKCFNSALKDCTYKDLKIKQKQSFKEFIKSDRLHSTIRDVLVQVVHEMSRVSERKFPYDGHFLRIWPASDQLSNGDTIELEYLFVIYVLDLELFYRGSHGDFRMYNPDPDHTGGEEIRSADICDSFANMIEHILKKLPLPNGLKHGGFDSPEFGGVRRNGPACTLLFLFEYHDNRILVSLSMTPAFTLPRSVRYYHTQNIPDMLKQFPLNFDDAYISSLSSLVYLVPKVPEETKWELSTAALEANILCALPAKSPITQVISVGNKINDKLNNYAIKLWPISQEMSNVIDALECYKRVSCDESKRDLIKLLTYCYVFLRQDIAYKYFERTQPETSINLTTIKHMVFEYVKENRNVFKVEKRKDIREKMVRHILHRIGGETHVEHYFFPRQKVHIWSFSAHTESRLKYFKEHTTKLTKKILQRNETLEHFCPTEGKLTDVKSVQPEQQEEKKAGAEQHRDTQTGQSVLAKITQTHVYKPRKPQSVEDCYLTTSGDAVYCESSKIKLMRIPDLHSISYGSLNRHITHLQRVSVGHYTDELLIGGMSSDGYFRLCAYSFSNDIWKMINQCDTGRSRPKCMIQIASEDWLVALQNLNDWKIRRYGRNLEEVWTQEVTHEISDTTIDSSDHLYCASTEDNCIHVYKGTPAFTTLSYVRKQSIRKPRSLCIDSRDNLLVLHEADADLGRMSGVVSLWNTKTNEVNHLLSLCEQNMRYARIRLHNDKNLIVSLANQIIIHEIEFH